jgi:hypothetical protein
VYVRIYTSAGEKMLELGPSVTVDAFNPWLWREIEALRAFEEA